MIFFKIEISQRKFYTLHPLSCIITVNCISGKSAGIFLGAIEYVWCRFRTGPLCDCLHHILEYTERRREGSGRTKRSAEDEGASAPERRRSITRISPGSCRVEIQRVRLVRCATYYCFWFSSVPFRPPSSARISESWFGRGFPI